MQPSDGVPAGRAAARGSFTFLAVLVTSGATLLAYSGSFSIPFLFDDVVSIVENPAVRELSLGRDFWTQPGGLTTSGRPVLALSLAINHALGGTAVWSYHLVNLLIHVGAALALFGTIRRTLLLPKVGLARGRMADTIALVAAVLWAVHPIQTAAVSYIVQRAESLAGLFYLLALYGFVRSVGAALPGRWRGFAIAMCALGMATKETVVTAPVVVLLFDRAFVSTTFAEAFRRNRMFHPMLASTWAISAALLVATSGRGATAGFATAVSVPDYALTQATALCRYLWLAFWPGELVFDYGTAVVENVADAFPYVVIVGALVAATVLALRRSLVRAFPLIAFFCLLAPSSSIVPVATQTIAEHRMYLPLAALITGAVVFLYRRAAGRTLTVLVALAIAYVGTTRARNGDYQDEKVLWADTVRKVPKNARAHNNLGRALFRSGNLAESMRAYENALRLDPKLAEAHFNLGVALAGQGRLDAAMERYRTALRLEPGHPEAHSNLGAAFIRAGREAEALPHLEQAIRANPGLAEAYNNLGEALLRLGRGADAISRLERALQLRPEYAEARYNLGNAFAAAGDMRAALMQYDLAVKLSPQFGEAEVNAGNALLALGQADEAILRYRRALQSAPGLVDAHFNLGSALLESGRVAEAIPPLEAAGRLNPEFPGVYRALGFALAQSGRTAEAISAYEQHLRRQPGDAETREELARLERSQATQPRARE